MWTHFLDDLPSSTTVVARYLGLGEHAREYLLFREPDSGSITCRAGVDIVIRGSAASSTVITKDFLLDYELRVTQIKRRSGKRLNR